MLYTPLRWIIFFTNYQRGWKFLVNSARIRGYRFPSSYCSYALIALVYNVNQSLLPVNVLHKSAVTNEALLVFLILAWSSACFTLFANWGQLLKLRNTDIFQNIYLNLLLMHAQGNTESRCVSPSMNESLQHGNREMHRLPYFRSSLPRPYRQYQSESAEIVDGFGNHERALRTAEGELVGAI